MGKVLHAIRLVGDVIDTVALGGFAPIRVPLDIVDEYTRMGRPELIRKHKTDEKGNIVFEKDKDYKEVKDA